MSTEASDSDTMAALVDSQGPLPQVREILTDILADLAKFAEENRRAHDAIIAGQENLRDLIYAEQLLKTTNEDEDHVLELLEKLNTFAQKLSQIKLASASGDLKDRSFTFITSSASDFLKKMTEKTNIDELLNTDEQLLLTGIHSRFNADLEVGSEASKAKKRARHGDSVKWTDDMDKNLLNIIQKTESGTSRKTGRSCIQWELVKNKWKNLYQGDEKLLELAEKSSEALKSRYKAIGKKV